MCRRNSILLKLSFLRNYERNTVDVHLLYIWGFAHFYVVTWYVFFYENNGKITQEKKVSQKLWFLNWLSRDVSMRFDFRAEFDRFNDD